VNQYVTAVIPDTIKLLLLRHRSTALLLAKLQKGLTSSINFQPYRFHVLVAVSPMYVVLHTVEDRVTIA
jgi:hypothetical protein